MKKQKLSIFCVRRLTAVVLCLAFLAVITLPFGVHAAGKGRVVRVGWYESPVSMKDESGRRSGYDYVYEQKLAAYTGWTYEYVEGSWSDLLQMLKDGEIDMMGDISYTEERSEFLLYPSLPMGTEDYYLFVTPDNTELTYAATPPLTERQSASTRIPFSRYSFRNGPRKTQSRRRLSN